MQRIGLGMLLVLYATLGAQSAYSSTVNGADTVIVVPLGKVAKDVVLEIKRGLTEEYGVKVEIYAKVGLPKSAYYKPRRRYRADKILDFLSRRFHTKPRSVKVIGVTAVDISTTKDEHRDWGVFGLGEMGGRSCVVSTFRLKRRARDRSHSLFRVRSVAVHEVGHTFGLDHCPTQSCVMVDAGGGIKNTDSGTGKMCERCRQKVTRGMPARMRTQ